MEPDEKKDAREYDESMDTSDSENDTDENLPNCPICLVAFTKQDIGTPESCDHDFCLTCILEWSKNVNTCPFDRQVFHLIFVRHCLGGEIYKQIAVSDRQLNEDEDHEDPTSCEVCGSTTEEDRMLLCDHCDCGYHLDCLNPPLRSVPEEDWFCPNCVGEMPGGSVNHALTIIPRTLRNRRVFRRIAPVISESSASGSEQSSADNSDDDSILYSLPGQPAITTKPKVRGKQRRRRLKRKTTKRRKVNARSGKGGKGKSSSGSASKRRRKWWTKKGKQAQTVRPTPTSVKVRLAERLGLCAPPVGCSLPLIRVRKPESTGEEFSVFGKRDALELIEEVHPRITPNMSSTALPAGHFSSRSEFKSTTPSASTHCTVPSADLLGSILSDVSLLCANPKNIEIQRDGKLKLRASSSPHLPSLCNTLQTMPNGDCSRFTTSLPSITSGGRQPAPAPAICSRQPAPAPVICSSHSLHSREWLSTGSSGNESPTTVLHSAIPSSGALHSIKSLAATNLDHKPESLASAMSAVNLLEGQPGVSHVFSKDKSISMLPHCGSSSRLATHNSGSVSYKTGESGSAKTAQRGIGNIRRKCLIGLPYHSSEHGNKCKGNEICCKPTTDLHKNGIETPYTKMLSTSLVNALYPLDQFTPEPVQVITYPVEVKLEGRKKYDSRDKEKIAQAMQHKTMADGLSDPGSDVIALTPPPKIPDEVIVLSTDSEDENRHRKKLSKQKHRSRTRSRSRGRQARSSRHYSQTPMKGKASRKHRSSSSQRKKHASRSPARPRTKSRSPVRRRTKSRSPNRKRTKSRSPNKKRTKSRSPNRKRTKSRSPYRKRSKSRSPLRRRTRSRSKLKSKSPVRRRHNSRSPIRKRSRSRSIRKRKSYSPHTNRLHSPTRKRFSRSKSPFSRRISPRASRRSCNSPADSLTVKNRKARSELRRRSRSAEQSKDGWLLNGISANSTSAQKRTVAGPVRPEPVVDGMAKDRTRSWSSESELLVDEADYRAKLTLSAELKQAARKRFHKSTNELKNGSPNNDRATSRERHRSHKKKKKHVKKSSPVPDSKKKKNKAKDINHRKLKKAKKHDDPKSSDERASCASENSVTRPAGCSASPAVSASAAADTSPLDRPLTISMAVEETDDHQESSSVVGGRQPTGAQITANITSVDSWDDVATISPVHNTSAVLDSDNSVQDMVIDEQAGFSSSSGHSQRADNSSSDDEVDQELHKKATEHALKVIELLKNEVAQPDVAPSAPPPREIAQKPLVIDWLVQKNVLSTVSGSPEHASAHTRREPTPPTLPPATFNHMNQEEEELLVSATELTNKQLLDKMVSQERIAEEVKVILKPHYCRGEINKDEYKHVMRNCVTKIYQKSQGRVNPAKVKEFVEKYIQSVVTRRKQGKAM